jgi:preprotein translocase subunit SecY
MQKRKNKSLAAKLIFTLFIALFLRAGNFIPVPYLDQQYIVNLINSNSSLRTFFNSKNLVLSVFSVGIIPNLNASILMQFLINSFPFFKRLQKEEGESGRQKIKQYSRSLTLIFAIVQSLIIAFAIRPILFNWNFEICTEITLILTTGSMIVLWLSDLITENGIGNGSSIVLTLNIISSLPNIVNLFIKTDNTFSIILNFLSFLSLLIGIIYIQEAVKKIPLVTVNQLYREKSQRTNQVRKISYLPLKIVQGGVMPIIFSSTILAFLTLLITNLQTIFGISTSFTNENLIRFVYLFTNFILIIFFSTFYSNLVLNSKEIAKDLNKMGVIIENIRPGQKTALYLKKILNRLSIIGGFLLGILVIIPNSLSSSSFSVTSLIILVGVTTEITRKIQTLSRQ